MQKRDNSYFKNDLARDDHILRLFLKDVLKLKGYRYILVGLAVLVLIFTKDLLLSVSNVQLLYNYDSQRTFQL